MATHINFGIRLSFSVGEAKVSLEIYGFSSLEINKGKEVGDGNSSGSKGFQFSI